jgi:hypothetical protein
LRRGSHHDEPSLDCSENVRALFYLGDWGKVKRQPHPGFTARFRQPNDCRPRKRHVWGTRQSRWLRTADGFDV